MSNASLLVALKAFDATAQCGSMTSAAKTLGVQQPTLSSQIRWLESKYQVELFHRKGRRLDLSEFGRALQEHCRRIFSAEADAHSLLAAAQLRYSGKLNIWAIGPHNVLPIIRAFQRRVPAVQIAVRMGHSTAIAEQICAYAGDVGLVLHRPEHLELCALPFRTQRLVVFAPKAHPLCRAEKLGFQDLYGQAFVLREPGSTTRRVFEQALRQAQISVQVALEMGSREAVREAVAQGMGLGVVAETAYIPDARIAKLAIADFKASTHVHLICRQDRMSSPLITAFLQTAHGLAAPDAATSWPRELRAF